MKIIDFRSDTVAWPTAEMRAAMANAEVGDDVYGEDPTVNKLQDLAAARTGKEAALFVPSGAMGNLAALENTHNRCNGVPLTVEYTRSVGELAHQNHLALHIDGARIFNAAVALGVPASELVAPADSVTFCLSKGLCAPVGSLLCGSQEFIGKALRARKQLGGGMRQAGVLAAAGIIALEKMVDRLAEDHARAKILADSLREIPDLDV